MLGPADVLDGVPELVPRIEVEALFGDGMRLIVLHDPIGRSDAPGRCRRSRRSPGSPDALGPFRARNTGRSPSG